MNFKNFVRHPLNWARTIATTPIRRARSKRRVPICALMLCTTLMVSGPVLAQESAGQKAVRIVVPSGPGSAIDLLARAYSKVMAETGGVNTYIENRAGGEGIPGVLSVLGAPADGNTLLFSSSSMVVLNSVMLPKVTKYDPLKDLVPVVTVSKATLILSLGSSTDFKSVREFIEAAKKSPGKYTCANASTTSRMSCEYFQVATGTKMLSVPYKATAAAVMGLAGGEVDAMIVDAASFQSQWGSGRVRAMAVAGEERLPALPNVPTMREEGVPDFLMTAWYGVFFKAGTAPNKVAAMQQLFQRAGESPTVKQALKTFVHEPYALSGDAMATMHGAEMEHWKKLVVTHGIKFAD